jgi:MinD-like ATPase involved in chromosome partitioning or flagellar assembly
MLKTFGFIREFSKSLDELITSEHISNYFIELKLSQEIMVYIISESIDNSINLFSQIDTEYSIDGSALNFEFFDLETSKEENYSYLFERENKIDYGLRRSLGNLIDDNSKNLNRCTTPLVTFYSYKGGVGRTTSLAMFASYYARLGKKVFVIDCDFEAPGLVNFFNISQFDTPKNGLIEYINDTKFLPSTKLDDSYIYEVSKVFSGEGKIHLMPSGNVFGVEREDYLEGLGRVDVHGSNMFMNDLSKVLDDIEKSYSPDVILVDSRTGFNNVFGSLVQLSNSVVALSGDDSQNQPGLEFLIGRFSEEEVKADLCLILSIVSTKVIRRFEKFQQKVANYYLDYKEEIDIPMFYFPRESMLELVGTEFEDVEDFKFFTDKDRPTSYKPFFLYLEIKISLIKSSLSEDSIDEIATVPIENKIEHTENDEVTESSNEDPLIDNSIDDFKLIPNENIDINELSSQIFGNLKEHFPEPYADNINFVESFYENDFYIRQCMHDLFLSEYKVLLGGKGTGKTAFYRALQDKGFFEMLIKRSEKQSFNFKIAHVISEPNSPELTGFIDFQSCFGDRIQNEAFVKRVWTVYIWVSIIKNSDIESQLVSKSFEIRNDAFTTKKFTDIVDDEANFIEIESDLYRIDKKLKLNDQRLLLTFDQLDFVVPPSHWNDGISPLIRLCQSNSWQRIQPKLFLRRDLFRKLGNITNKNALLKQSINLEWSQNEMYAFFFKVIFAYSKDNFLSVLKTKLSESWVKNEIERKLNKKNQYNQLPPEKYLLKPLVDIFFGEFCREGDTYDSLYNNVKNADLTISLRPFLDLIKYAMDEQEKGGGIYKKDAILGVDYCFFKSVRSMAVDRYFKDFANEAGNQLILHFIEDIRNSLIPEQYKYSSLLQNDFEKLVRCVKDNHSELDNVPLNTFIEMLELNGIMFITFIPGGIKKFSFAYLYKYYLGLSSPSSIRNRK